VFVVEQNCAFVDADGIDLKSWHLLGYMKNGVLAAYARIVPAGVSYVEVSVGRIVTAPKYRHLGMGKDLMEELLRRTEELYSKVPIRIAAQKYLENFYTSYGFRAEGEPFLWDGIWHVYMLR